MRHHGLQQHLGTVHIVVVVFQRVGHGLSNQRVGRKVNHAVDLLGFEHGIDKCAVADIALIELCLRMHRFDVSGFQIISDYDLTARVD